MKPMLACDYDESKLRFPLIAQPKIDGVRGLNFQGSLTARSLKPHRNEHTTRLYSQSCFVGFDGELAAESELHPSLCRITSSALSTRAGTPFTLWWLFDFVIPGLTYNLTYIERYKLLLERISNLRQTQEYREASAHLRVVPSVTCENLQMLRNVHAGWSDLGYEGTIIRDPQGKYKQGRSTVREGGLLRIKDFEEAEAVVIRIVEGQMNGNEAQTNELGKTFRSTDAEGMIPNGQVGTIICAKEDGSEFSVGPGELDVLTRCELFLNPSRIVNKRIIYKHFPKGVKDKPRFPTFKCFAD
jgi:DNA ligase 1